MKIKLQDYSLISNEQLKFFLGEEEFKLYQIEGLAIPSEKLADVSFNAGEYCEKEKLKLSFDNPKSRFLNSEIEIL